MAVQIPDKYLIDETIISTECNYCGSEVDCSWWKGKVIVDPCEKCLQERYDDGYKEGVDEVE